MQRSKNSHLATRGITVALLCSFACAASGAEQMMRARPAPSAAQSVVAPAGLPPVANPSGTPMPQRTLPPPSQGGGMAQLNSAAGCASNNTPRIGNINGRLSGGILFQPGDSLNIAGCGFGSGGQAYLSVGIGVAVPLIVETWSDSNIRAHIDAALGGVTDIGTLNVHVRPNGAPELASAGSSSFHAARETGQWALPPALGKYSNVYGTPKASLSTDGKSTIVERNARYIPFCPPQKDQSDMVDLWSTDSDHLKQGFKVDGVIFQNMTIQDTSVSPLQQNVLVGTEARAQHEESKKRIVVIFEGHSSYDRKSLGDGGGSGYSQCTSRYSVSARITGPRGISPFK